mgnify:CR=1 FL=1
MFTFTLTDQLTADAQAFADEVYGEGECRLDVLLTEIYSRIEDEHGTGCHIVHELTDSKGRPHELSIYEGAHYRLTEAARLLTDCIDTQRGQWPEVAELLERAATEATDLVDIRNALEDGEWLAQCHDATIEQVEHAHHLADGLITIAGAGYTYL